MNKFLTKVIVTAVILGFFGTFMVLVSAYGYGWRHYKAERVQPIDYSHQTHVQKNSMKCTQCHLNVDKGQYATVPPTKVCVDCHLTTARDIEGVKKLLKYWDNKQPIPWKRIYKIPTPGMVYFPHKRHVKYFMPMNLQEEFLRAGLSKDVAGTLAYTYGKMVTQEFPNTQIQEALMSQNVDSKLAEKVSGQWGILHTQALKSTCYQCHGKVEYMATPRKMSPLKMGWCVTCHVKYQAPRDCSTCHK